MKNGKKGSLILVIIVVVGILFFVGLFKYEDYSNPYDISDPYKVAGEGEAAVEGDTVIIDYVGTVDGVAFDGGTADDYALSLGSGTFIDGFEEQLIGVTKGQDIEVNVTFPADYSSPELANKDAVFQVHVDEVLKMR